MMKKTTTIILLLLSITLLSQVTNQGKPVSWKLSNDYNIETIKLPKFNLKKLQDEDLINDKLVKPFRFGFKHDVNFSFNDGKWINLENGDRIWKIKFQSKNALSLNFIFDDFYLPQGATLYLYNEDKSDLLGAYTSANNNVNNSLGTWIVKGETVYIEYFEPAKQLNKGRLHINTITHGYRNADTVKELKNLGESGDCNQDVDCPIGADWEDKKDYNKRSVAFILSNGADWCSGALINNTNNDGTPYFLTANHCINGQNTANWVFRFGWISPNPVCATFQNSTNGPTNMQINGAVVKANNLNSDFALLELNSVIPPSWNRTWSGWDKTDTTPNFVVGIHHPSGDIMKICRDNAGTIPVLSGGVYEWEITSAGGGWEIGVTEGGSSGSPLYNQDGRIIGQLHRGGASCSGTVDNGSYDQYGRFAHSWDDISGNSNQLKPWLDPNNTNLNTLNTYPSIYNLDADISINIPNLNCGENQVNPTITLTNNGQFTLTSTTINWNLDNGTNTTINWTGSLQQYSTTNINLGNMILSNGNHTFNATVSNPNNNTDENADNDTNSKDVAINIFATTQVHLDLLTDDYSNETTWNFKDQNGTVLYSGGPYNGGTDDNIHFYEDFNVPTNQCYTFEILDSANIPDGICCQYGNGSYTLTTDDNTVIFSGGSFSNNEITEIAIDNTVSINDILSKSITIYPNPTKNSLNVNLNNISGEFNYVLVNTLGQKVQEGELINTNNVLNLSNINKSIYFLKIKDIVTDNNMVKKIIVN